MSYPAKVIANYFIEKALTEKDLSLTLMKLLKLIYIAHGWNLAIYDKPLIDESIQAWQYGPVIEDVYHALKYNALDPLKDTIVDYAIDNQGQLITNDFKQKMDKPTIDLLNKIWTTYKPNTGIQLSNWSHDSNGPWHKVWFDEKGYQNKSQSIPNQIIKSYFKELGQKHDL